MSVYQGGGVTGTGGPPSSFNAPWNRWQDWVYLVLGIWLIVAPWAMQQAAGNVALASVHMATNAWVVGVVLIVMCLWALARPASPIPEGINMIAGIWLFVSPWVLGLVSTMHSATVNDWIVGIVVLLLAISAVRHTRGGMTRTA